jgi:protocatechuate 3,4-dioxygenase alpha subunit
MTITPSQTIGPFFHIGAARMEAPNLVPDSAESAEAITVTGHLLDGAGVPVSDAMVEIWQADSQGNFPPSSPPAWRGFGRCFTDEEGRFAFVTIRPGRVDALQAPHIDVSVFARGLLQRLVTRMYFPDEVAANAADPVLTSIEQPAARATLVAAGTPPDLRFDIHLQGDNETVFFVY